MKKQRKCQIPLDIIAVKTYIHKCSNIVKWLSGNGNCNEGCVKHITEKYLETVRNTESSGADCHEKNNVMAVLLACIEVNPPKEVYVKAHAKALTYIKKKFDNGVGNGKTINT